MHDSIETVEEPEHKALCASSSSRENDFLAFVGKAFLDQTGYVARVVLAVAVHDDDGMTRAIRFYVGQPHSNSALVTEVAANRENIDAFDGCKRVLADILGHKYRGRVVHHQDFRS